MDAVSPLTHHVMFGLGLLGRAELAFGVMDIACIQQATLPREAFITLMITACMLYIRVPLTSTLWRPRYPAASIGRSTPEPGGPWCPVPRICKDTSRGVC